MSAATDSAIRMNRPDAIWPAARARHGARIVGLRRDETRRPPFSATNGFVLRGGEGSLRQFERLQFALADRDNAVVADSAASGAKNFISPSRRFRIRQRLELRVDSPLGRRFGDDKRAPGCACGSVTMAPSVRRPAEEIGVGFQLEQPAQQIERADGVGCAAASEALAGDVGRGRNAADEIDRAPAGSMPASFWRCATRSMRSSTSFCSASSRSTIAACADLISASKRAGHLLQDIDARGETANLLRDLAGQLLLRGFVFRRHQARHRWRATGLRLRRAAAIPPSPACCARRCSWWCRRWW